LEEASKLSTAVINNIRGIKQGELLPCFVDEELLIQRGKLICLRSHNLKMAEF
jgi:hypothetical protein